MTENKTKKAIREVILKKRDAIPKNLKAEKDATITDRIISLPEFINAAAVLLFASFRSEVNTTEIIKTSLNMGKCVILPKVDKRNNRLRLYEIKDLSELAPGYMKIPEPSVSEKRLRDINEVDLVIVPGAAFDVHGNRLGYGAGFYDMLLSGIKKKVPIIAPAYEEQVTKKIPAEPHDIKVGKIVTDKRVIDC